MSLSGPATAWAWTQSNISWETWKCVPAAIQSDRAWEVKRWDDKWQIIAKCWWAKLAASNKKILEAVKELHLSAELRGMNTYAMYVSFFYFFFFIHLRICDNSVFALSIWCMECRLMWGAGNLKQFNIRQQHNKMWKKWSDINTFARHCII